MLDLTFRLVSFGPSNDTKHLSATYQQVGIGRLTGEEQTDLARGMPFESPMANSGWVLFGNR
jgi:hypothetical protein